MRHAAAMTMLLLYECCPERCCISVQPHPQNDCCRDGRGGGADADDIFVVDEYQTDRNNIIKLIGKTIIFFNGSSLMW